MAGDFSQLLDQGFSDLEAAVKSWRKLAARFSSAQTNSGRKVSGPLHAAGWDGESARVGFAALEATESMLGTAHVNAQLVASVLDTANERMQSAKRALRRAVHDAQCAGHKVTASGRVVRITAGDATGGGAPHRAAVEDANSELASYQDRIDRAVEKARSASFDAFKALHELDPFDLDKQYGLEHAKKDAERIAKMMGISPARIPHGGDPERNARWWADLGQDERRMYLAAYPDELGRLDGLPADTRDQANRTVLEAKFNDLALREENGRLSSHDQWTYSSLGKLKNRLDKEDSVPPDKRLYVLALDTDVGDGRAVIARGNPDKAAHTAVLVPGTGSDLSNMTGQIDRLDRTQTAAGEFSRGESVSVISWLGYDTPEIDGSVATTGRAEDGATDLRRFAEGTRAAHEGSESHLTVIGHSYGSTMVGTAASEGSGLGADDIISLGSPGMNVETASELNVDRGHFWAGASQQDPVVRYFSGLTLGPNPASHDFGGQPMAVNDGGHSSYWDQGGEGESLRNQARVIVGRPARLGPYYDAESVG